MDFDSRENNTGGRIDGGAARGMRRAKARRRRRLFLRLGCIAFLLFLISVSPVFWARNIEINELEAFSEEEIRSMLGLTERSSVLYFSGFLAERRLKESPYIKDVEVKKALPSGLRLNITERKVRGYVPYMDAYLYIDEYGMVLDIKDSYEKALPVVNGLKFDKFTRGAELEVDNKDSFNIIVKIAQLMTKYEILDTVMEIDVSRPERITAKAGKVIVILGGIEDLDTKIRTMKEALGSISDEYAGTLDLSDTTKPIIFKYMT